MLTSKWSTPLGCAVGAFVLALLCFASVPSSHLADSDGYLAHVSAVSEFDHESARHVFAALQAHYQGIYSGWFPVAALPLSLWQIDSPLPLVKMLQFGLIAISFVLFALIVRRLFTSSTAAILAVVFTIAAWQFRFPHDPVIGTSLITPWSADWVLGMFLILLEYRANRKRLWLAAACVTSTIALLTGPIAWGLAAFFIVAELLENRKGEALLFAFLTVAVAFGSSKIAAPHAPWLHHANYLESIFAQLIAPLPTSFRAFGHLPVGHVPALYHAGTRYVDDRFINIPAITSWGWLATLACTAIAFFGLRKQSAVESRSAWILGFGLWIVPAVLLGPDTWWRNALPFGQSFDGVYYQYFGIGLVSAGLVLRLCTNAGRFGRVIAPVTALAVFIACYGNIRADGVALAHSARLDDSRALLQRAAAADFFASLPSDAIIAIPPSAPFANGIHSRISDAKYAIYHYSKRRFTVTGEARPGTWLLQTTRHGQINVILARVAGRRGTETLVDRAHGFTVFPDAAQSAITPQRGIETLVRNLADGALIEVRRKCGPVPLDSAFDAETPQLQYGAGFSQEGPTGYTLPLPKSGVYPKMFMDSAGVITIRPTRCSPQTPLHFDAQVLAGGPGTLTILSPALISQVPVSPQISTISLLFPKLNGPIRLRLTTSAPSADLNHVDFRYERDVPHDVRLLIEPVRIWEDTEPNTVAQTVKH